MSEKHMLTDLDVFMVLLHINCLVVLNKPLHSIAELYHYLGSYTDSLQLQGQKSILCVNSLNKSSNLGLVTECCLSLKLHVITGLAQMIYNTVYKTICFAALKPILSLLSWNIYL